MNITIVEDQAILRDLLQLYIQQRWRGTVISSTGSGLDAVRLIRSEHPDLVFLDLHLPDISGFDVVDRIRPHERNVRLLAISGYCDPVTVTRVKSAGMHGFLNKSTLGINVLTEAVKALTSGGMYFPQREQSSVPTIPKYLKILSNRELEVLALISQAMNDIEISDRLGVTVRTAQTHRSNILRKLGIDGTPKLMRFAHEQGLD